VKNATGNDFQKSEKIFESMVIDHRGIRKRFEAITLNMILYEGRLGVIDISDGECRQYVDPAVAATGDGAIEWQDLVDLSESHEKKKWIRIDIL
jgi:hypothetical protein